MSADSATFSSPEQEVPSLKQEASSPEQEAAAQRRLRYRMGGMILGLVLFHVCLAWAIAGTTVDMQDHFHTNYWALGATLFWALFAVYHMSVS